MPHLLSHSFEKRKKELDEGVAAANRPHDAARREQRLPYTRLDETGPLRADQEVI
jgi:hypothetical protein